jgi:2-C-methyl-D-erythritol 4-phosphate cytidylyltransferase/2-C-methyl-D-erythritol 2,4-cyclodiphosphate synthase
MEPKALLPIGGRPILSVAAASAVASPQVRGLVVTYPPGWEGRARACVGDLGAEVRLVEGGETRQASVRAALAQVREAVEIVAVHDAARPFAPPDLFSRVLEAVEDGAVGAVPVLGVTDTVLRVRGGVVEGAEPRDELALGQTPQAFRTSVLREAHAKAEATGASFSDDASLLRWAGFDVRAIPGDPANVKITTLADLAQADRRMEGSGD